MKKKAATGRPPKKFDRKEKLLAVKTTVEQRELYERAALNARRELSDWVRLCLDECARRQLGES